VRICLVSNPYPPLGEGGVELYVRGLATALGDQHHVVVVTMEPGAHLQPRREITSEGVVVYRLAPFFRAFDLYHPQVAMIMSDIIKHERPDVVHVHNWKGLSLAAVLSSVPSSAPHIPIAMTLHDEGLLSGRFLSNLNRRLVKRAGLVISPSRYLLDQHLQRGFFRQAMQQILPNGIEGNPPPQPSPSGRTQGGSLKPTFDILYMGRVHSSDGPDFLIRAFRRLADPSLRLHIAGAGPALEFCRSLANGDPRIRLYGFVEGAERIRLLSTADCVVLPSLWPENAPVTIQEAFQFGPVVIASRIGGIPEMVRDGVNGLLVEPGDEAGIGAAIERLRSSPELAASLRASASETARLYDMRFHVAHLVDAYQRLLATDRVGPFDQRAA